MAVETPAAFNQGSTYGAEQTRRAIGSHLLRGASVGSIVGGLVATGDMALSAPGSGMSVNVAPGEAWVPGSSSATQSGYYSRVSSTSNLAIAASDPTNPRVDRVVAVVTDSAYAGGTNTFAVSVVTGTPTAGATLANLNGAGLAPASSLTLGYVLVPNASVNVTGGNISNVAAVALLSGAVSSPEAAFSTYKTLHTDVGFLNGLSSGVYLFTNGVAVLASGATFGGSGMPQVYYYDPADGTAGTRANKWRVRAALQTNATATNVTFTVGLYPVTAAAGGLNLVTLTVGTVISGSTVAFASQAASSQGQGNSGDFAAPSAGHYVLGVTGSQASNSAAILSAYLQMRQV